MPWDLFCYQFLVWALEKSFDLPMFWTTHSACRAIRDEADFLVEAKYSERAAAAWAQSEFASRVHVPSVFWQYTSRRVLAQEWVEGIKINDQQRLDKAGFDRQARQLSARACGVITRNTYPYLPETRNPLQRGADCTAVDR
jgi:predicted unusual protein kinase regulating ubiquinone biosynthesis (AarF/ABC1/UbiB family)